MREVAISNPCYGSRLVQPANPKVLLVDDDVSVLRTLSKLLKHFRFDVVACSDSTCAMEQLSQRNDIAMLLCDYEMPEINGVELAQAAKSKNPAMPVFVLSGCHPPAISSAPWDAWFLKGTPVTELVRKLNKALPVVNCPSLEGHIRGKLDSSDPLS
jgi:CheY-like chemotaxis protein